MGMDSVKGVAQAVSMQPQTLTQTKNAAQPKQADTAADNPHEALLQRTQGISRKESASDTQRRTLWQTLVAAASHV